MYTVEMRPDSLATSVPTGPSFDLLLVAHVASAFIGFGVVAITGIQAFRARVGFAALTPGLRRYFRPGTNWLGRVVFLVPVLGAALVLDSGGTFGFGDTFVVAGIVLWAASAVLAEIVLWPGERHIQALVSGEPLADPGELERSCRRASLAAAAITAMFVAAVVLMVTRP
ncbi:MAG: hypothetical protein ACYCUF_06575 [Acidimicrobiales bacterium]|nr:DUF2269 family protein [Actinomycetota bacterium]